MKIHRLPLFISGVVNPAAREILGAVLNRAGQSFSVSTTAPGGETTVHTVDLLGDECFIPAGVPDYAVADIEKQLAPMAQTREAALNSFLMEALAVPA